MEQLTKVTVEATVNAPVEKVWKAWNTPGDIMQWNTADPSWHCPSSENDLRVGGSFKTRMEAKDGTTRIKLCSRSQQISPPLSVRIHSADGAGQRVSGRVRKAADVVWDGKTDIEMELPARTCVSSPARALSV